MTQFASGATSTERKPQYRLIPTEALDYMADRFGFGAESHGERNWEQGVGDDEYMKDRQNHAIAHLMNYVNGRTTTDDKGHTDTPKDHLKAAITNLAMCCYFEEH